MDLCAWRPNDAANEALKLKPDYAEAYSAKVGVQDKAKDLQLRRN